MIPREMLKVLSGSTEAKRVLFDQLLEKAINEELSDDELPILEALKKDLLKPESRVVSLSATVVATSGVKA